VGDTVGDPFKDTSGPSLNILLKLMSVVALVIAPLIALEKEPVATVEAQKPVLEIVSQTPAETTPAETEEKTEKEVQ